MTDEGVAVNESAEGFIQIRLQGEKFDAKGMPADSALELKALRDVLFQMARQAWLDDHPGRKKVPDGFDDLFDLRLVSIAEGSARPQLVLNIPRDFREDNDEFDMVPAMRRAPKMLVDALASVEDDRVLPPTVPPKQVSLLAKIGRTLGEDDVIEIGVGPDSAGPDEPVPAPVSVTRTIRDTLDIIDKALKAAPEPMPAVLEGIITELDGELRSFHLRVIGQSILTRCEIAPGATTLAALAKRELAPDGISASDVRVQGWAVPDSSGRFRVLHETYDLEVVRSLGEKVLVTRLEDLASLEDGWWEPTSLRPQSGVIDAVRSALVMIAASPVRPDIVARPDGSVAFETEVGERHLVAVIEDNGAQMFLYSDDGETDEPDESTEQFEPVRLTQFLATGRIVP